MYFIVIFTLFSGLTLVLMIHESVVFHKANEIALTRAKWLSSFIIDLKSYQNLLNRLSEDLRKARITVHGIEQLYDFPHKQDYKRIVKGLKGEIVVLLNKQHTMVENYIELHTIHKEMKRSLILIIGKGLSYLFGTDTGSNFKTIHPSVSRLIMSQEVIAYVVDKNILVSNITRVEMSENKQTLNKIVGSLENLDVKLGNVTQVLEKEVFYVGQLVQLYLRLDSIIHAIRRTVW